MSAAPASFRAASPVSGLPADGPAGERVVLERLLGEVEGPGDEAGQEEPVFEPYRSAKPKLVAGHAFREGWVWPKPIDQWFERQLGNLTDPAPRPIVHVCSGSSRLGEVRVDRYHAAAGVKADMLKLPFKDGAFGTTICDPPYELRLQERAKLMFELARITRAGGRLLFKAPWHPFEGHWRDMTVTIATRRIGMPRDGHLLWRATRRERGPKAGKGQRKAAQRGGAVA